MEILELDKIEGITSEEVKEENLQELEEKIDEILSLLKENKGIGLAAPQVGIFKRMFIWTRNNGVSYEVIYNPEIYRDGGYTNVIETCLSDKNKSYFIKRLKKVMVIYYINVNGKLRKKVENFKKPFSFVWQHELDHLNGNSVRTKGEFFEEKKEEINANK
jgi:peptide deformylase